MKLMIGLLVLFIVAKQISCENEGNFTAPNETISSTTPKPFFKKMVDFFTGRSHGADEGNSSVAKPDANSTLISSARTPPTHNVTTSQPTKSSPTTAATTTTTTTAAARTTRPSETTINATKESASTAKEKEDDLNQATSKAEEEKPTAEDSLARDATQEYDAGDSTISERALLATAPTEEPADLDGGDDSNPSAGGEGPLKDKVDDDSTSPEEAESPAPENLTNNNTGATSDMQPDPLQRKEHCINYIDKLVSSTLSKHADHLDPLPLPDRKLHFEAPFLLSSVEGRVGFYDGKVTGISQGRPINECSVETRGDQITLVSGIRVDEALVSYKGSATLLQFGPRITVEGVFSGITAGLRITFPKGGGRGRVEEFRVTGVNGIEISIKGLGAVDWAAEYISERTAKVFLSAFEVSVEGNLRKALEEEIKGISYP